MLDLLRIVYQNMGPAASTPRGRRRSKACATPSAGCSRSTRPPARRRNVQRHYDLSGELYRLFLDADMQYSCAYFEQPDMTLEEAQLAKKRHIAAKLRLKPGQSVLDIGSGWGGLGLYLAKTFEADVLGVTLSTEQHARRHRARAAPRAWTTTCISSCSDYRDISRALRPHRLGRHVRACRRQPLPHLLRQDARRC